MTEINPTFKLDIDGEKISIKYNWNLFFFYVYIPN